MGRRVKKGIPKSYSWTHQWFTGVRITIANTGDSAAIARNVAVKAFASTIGSVTIVFPAKVKAEAASAAEAAAGFADPPRSE